MPADKAKASSPQKGKKGGALSHQKQKKNKAAGSKKGTGPGFLSLSFCMALVAAGAYFLYQNPEGLEPWTGMRHPNKPYKTFMDFYPYYQEEHTDKTCRLLHIIGTSIVLTIMAASPSTFVSMALAFVVAYACCGLFAFMPNGAAEAAVMVTVFFSTHYFLKRSIKLALVVMLVGYAFAWVGHFFFEQNKPATFIYPSFSLMSDFFMTFRVITQVEPLDPRA
ncbi:hypothetical protein PTSG_11825 [Salpingoeca rosetta]|uniref:DUF962 domain-containing protein n=1 Tax=Salpingoeca rosetta (strain ATCC 50818 / BSB-021) TaxID=946362 RepID=F2TZM8_SALR5|nr:uncharacterized protein PTSG_11825 [Salpingoeca rosetta]EGD79052.1 hypothetical protein PTSG_11825 [Salpingoeca rosetta]|eukprot:XP_004998008.1 hypothetical protein PTSG_11825 [Salpingoeca rosetta]